MKTAEQIQDSLKEIILDHMRSDDAGYQCIYEGSELNTVLPELVDCVKSIITEACKEQREICALACDAANVAPSTMLWDAITNAPEPKMI